MRFTSEFIDLVRTHLYKPGSRGDQILTSIVKLRQEKNLDNKFSAENPWNLSDATLDYEIRKLGTVFAALSSFPCGTPKDVIATLTETYPASEIDEIVSEYFPELLESSTVSHAARP